MELSGARHDGVAERPGATAGARPGPTRNGQAQPIGSRRPHERAGGCVTIIHQKQGSKKMQLRKRSFVVLLALLVMATLLPTRGLAHAQDSVDESHS